MKLRDVQSTVKSLLQRRDLSETYWITLKEENNITWALVLAWCDGFDNENDEQFKFNTHRICGKIAFNNSYMQSDYDLDWDMPWYKDGDVCYTDCSIESEEDIARNFMYWEREWEAIKNNEELMTCMESNDE